MRVARRNGNVAQRLVFTGDVLGFRCVNGVCRGGSYYGSSAFGVRERVCYRMQLSKSVLTSVNVGFRLNGVFRSGVYGDSGLRCRSGGIRWNSSKRTYVHNGVGFL